VSAPVERSLAARDADEYLSRLGEPERTASSYAIA
jgi:hypothetical protein